MNANNKTRPYVIDRDKTQLNPDDGTIYAGCYVYAVIDIWAMDNKFRKRVCASLSGVQFYKDDDAFTSSGIASADDFDDLSVDNKKEFSV
ncbi:ssDNA-binding protein [Gilliamella sp. G0441]|uniref:ssDNA-binding protein n=1 Tax=Gilliamella sp. G0441 TaxID=3384760 RepID=UPI003D33BCFC